MSDNEQVQQAAQAAGMDTQAFCDRNYKTFEVRMMTISMPGSNA